MNLQPLIEKIKIKKPNMGTAKMAMHLLDVYFSHYYKGKEHDYILGQYAEYITPNFVIDIGMALLSQTQGSVDINKYTKDASEHYHKLKLDILCDWKNSEYKTFDDNMYNKFVNYLKKCYTLSEEDEVREELGL